MKTLKYYFILLALLVSSVALGADAWFPEGIQVKGASTIGAKAAADSKSILDLRSTTKGLLAPRMTTAQRTAIASPPEGLLVFDTDLNALFQYTGAAWQQLASLTGSEALTNKTIDASLNTVTNVPLTTGVTGLLPIGNGGTGQATKAPAFDALSPMSASGDIIYGGASGTGTRLAAGTNGHVLTLTAGLPVWSASSGGSTAIAPVMQRLDVGSGTWNTPFVFTITSGSATVGATYTNNAITYTVVQTVASATQVVMTGSGAPTSSGTLTKASGTGDATLTFSASRAPLYIEVMAQGAGGGGSGSGSPVPGAGGAGNSTTFGSDITATAGGGGAWAGQAGGTAGSYTIGSALTPYAYGVAGAAGGGSTGTGVEFYWPGGMGGTSGCGGAGGGSGSQAGSDGSGGAGATNTGAGGPGGGGGGGGCIRALIRAPAFTYSYTSGAAGAGGTAGSGGGAAAGGGGGDGFIVVRSHYQ